MTEIDNFQIEIKVLKERQSSLIKDYEIKIFNLKKESEKIRKERKKFRDELYREQKQILEIKDNFERTLRDIKKEHDKIKTDLTKKNEKLSDKIETLKTKITKGKSPFLLKDRFKSEEYNSKIQELQEIIEQKDKAIKEQHKQLEEIEAAGKKSGGADWITRGMMKIRKKLEQKTKKQ